MDVLISEYDEILIPEQVDPVPVNFTERLPLELRRKIYAYVLYQPEGIVIGEPKPAKSFPTALVGSAEDAGDLGDDDESSLDEFTEESELEEEMDVNATPLLKPLLLVNHQVRKEAMPIILEVNIINLRERTSKVVNSTIWFTDWLKKHQLFNSVRAINFQGYAVTTIQFKNEGHHPDLDLMEACQNLQSVTLHLEHYHHPNTRKRSRDLDRSTWDNVCYDFTAAVSKWRCPGDEAAYASGEVKRIKMEYQLDRVVRLPALRALKICPSVLYLHHSKGHIYDFFRLVSANLHQWFREHQGPYAHFEVSSPFYQLSFSLFLAGVAEE